jgi:hypothetical protein
MSKLFRKAKAGLIAGIERRFSGYQIEKSYSDYCIIRYNGNWLYVIEQCKDGRILITHENASPTAYSRSNWAAHFDEEFQVDDMLAEVFRGSPSQAMTIDEAAQKHAAAGLKPTAYLQRRRNYTKAPTE